jgi:hypothetical protein
MEDHLYFSDYCHDFPAQVREYLRRQKSLARKQTRVLAGHHKVGATEKLDRGEAQICKQQNIQKLFH